MKKSILAIILIFSFFISSCSNTNNMMSNDDIYKKEQNLEKIVTQDSNADLEEVLYESKYYPFPGGYKAKAVARLGNVLLMHGSRNGEHILGITQYEVDTHGEVRLGKTKILYLNDPDSVDEKHIYGICAGKDSYFYVISGELPSEYTLDGSYYTNPDYLGRFAILKYTEHGKFVSKQQVTLPSFTFMQGFFVDRNNRIILYGGNTIACIEANGIVKETNTGENSFIQSASLCSDLVVFQIYYDNNKTFLYDPTTGRIEEFTIYAEDASPFFVGIDNSSICQGLDEEYILCQDSRFYSCNLDDAVCKELFRWNYGMYYKECPYVCRLSEKSFICSISGEESFLVTGIVQRPKIEKNVVNVALYDMEQSGIGSVLRQINASGGEYEYVEIIYKKDELERLLADISSDSPPDLLLFNNNVNTASDEFEDLYTYIDSDEELSRDSFIPNLLEALSVDGELHEIWRDVSVNTLAARVSDVGKATGLTVEDYNLIASNSEKYEAVFQTFMSKENLLKWVSTVGISAFVHKGSGSCNFDDPEFSQMLEWCKSMGNEIPEGSDFPSLDISEVLLTVEMISTPERIKNIRNNFGEPYTFVGFPTGDGNGHFYSNGFNGCMAIPKASKNKDGAWEFIRSQLVESAQVNVEYSLPVNIFAFKHKAESVLSDEEISLFMELLNNTKHVENYSDSVVRNIIMECGKAYLLGDKTIEDTVKLIQTKASIYFAEQYG